MTQGKDTKFSWVIHEIFLKANNEEKTALDQSGKILFRIEKNIMESIVHNYIFRSLNQWF